jgi:LPS export ABC transporter protein LptC
MNFRTLIVILASAFIIAVSCERPADVVPKSDYLSLPSLEGEDFRVTYSDSGRLQLVMTAPLIEKWTNRDDPYTEFRKGLHVDYFDGDTVAHGSVTARYAKHDDKNDIWQLRDSVVVINEDSTKLLTDLLNWDWNKDLIYTDHQVEITGPDQQTHAIGFESDSHLRRQKLGKVSGIYYFEDKGDSIE